MFLLAFQALTIADLKAGENALIHTGASGVGVAANQLARFWHASVLLLFSQAQTYNRHCSDHVITTASAPEKLRWLLSLPNGPTHAVNYKTQDFAAEVKAITDGKGADVVIDFVGRTHFLGNVDALAMDGRMTMLGLLSGPEVDKVNLGPLLYKRLRIQGSTLRARSVPYQAELIQRFKDTVMDKVTGQDGPGPLRTYLHAVRITFAHHACVFIFSAGLPI